MKSWKINRKQRMKRYYDAFAEQVSLLYGLQVVCQETNGLCTFSFSD
nr:hypothetical protein [Polaromonas sp.]